MKRSSSALALITIAVLLMSAGCAVEAEQQQAAQPEQPRAFQPQPQSSPAVPDLQAEITDARFKTTSSDIGKFDFRNFTYPLPRGWQHPDSSEITLENGKVKPVAVDIQEEMTDEEKAARRAARRIGMSYVTTRFLDATADGQDEAVVILKVETGGAAIPQ